MSRPSMERAFGAFQNTSASLPLRDRLRAVLALFEPETVATAAELDALPVGSVVLDPRGHAIEKRYVPPDGFGIAVGWYPTGSPSYMRRAPLPATVLHRGDDR